MVTFKIEPEQLPLKGGKKAWIEGLAPFDDDLLIGEYETETNERVPARWDAAGFCRAGDTPLNLDVRNKTFQHLVIMSRSLKRSLTCKGPQTEN